MEDSTFKKYALFVPVIVAIILELLPFGVVIQQFNPSTDSCDISTYSYFSLTPYGLGNPMPFITAVLSCLLLVVIFVHIVFRPVKTISVVLCAITALCSVIPLFLRTGDYSILSAIISALFIVELAAMIYLKTPQNSTKN